VETGSDWIGLESDCCGREKREEKNKRGESGGKKLQNNSRVSYLCKMKEGTNASSRLL
jgi:hypothetical protein